MSYLLSGLNIQNISEYDYTQSYNKYDIIDFQLNSEKSIYPSYTGLGGTGLLFWFNNEYIESFNLDLNNNIISWKNKYAIIEDEDQQYANLLQLSDETLRPFVNF